MNGAHDTTERVFEKNIDASVHGERGASASNDYRPERESELTVRSALALLGSALAYFSTAGFMNAFGVFQAYYTIHYLPTYSNFQISWLGSFASFMLFAGAAPAGFLADRYGPTVPMCAGAIMQLVAVFMISLCRDYYQFFLAQGLLLGLGMSFVAIPASTVVPMYFKRNRGLAQGVSIGGSSLGGVLWPVALDQLLNHDGVSFGWSMRTVGFVMIPLLILAVACLQRPMDHKSKREEPGRDHESATSTSSATPTKSKLAPLRTTPFILLCTGLALAMFGFWDPLFYTTTYAVSLGTSETLAFYLLSVLNGASLFGRILPGLVADRFGHFNTLIAAVSLSALLCFLWTTATSVAGLVVWVAAYGFASGSFLSLQLACATVLSDEGSHGAAIGIAMASVSLTGLFGTPIAGELVARGGYVALSCFAGGMLVLGGLALMGARMARDVSVWARV